MQRHLAAASLGALAACLWGQAALAAPPPVSAFARLPAIDDATISPDGTHVLMLGSPVGERQVSIAELDSSKVAVLKMGQVRSRAVRWAGDELALVRTSVQSPQIQREVAWFHRDVVIDTNAKPVNRLLNSDDYLASSYPILGIVQGDNPQIMMMGFTRTNVRSKVNDSLFKSSPNDVFSTVLLRVDARSGKGSIAEKGAPATSWWSVDLNGVARVRYDGNDETGSYTLLTRAKGASNWKVVFKSKDSNQVDDYLGYSDPEDAIYLREEDAAGNVTVVRRKLADLSTEAVTTQTGRRAVRVLWDDLRAAPVALVYGESETEYQWLDPELGRAFAVLSKSLKPPTLTLAGWSADKSRIVAAAEGLDTPPQWYLLDLKAKSLSALGEAYPELNGAALGQTEWTSYKARDGLTIPAYVTMPTARGADKRPLVVLPHGGPASRDEPAFDWWTQFLASRGYAVLRPQFRGSAGFGKSFEEAGHREWAGKMQTDLIDGVDHLAARGLIDPKRVCIVGGSYGGYAALASATFYGSHYRCAVSVNGVADLPAMIGEYRRGYADANPALTYWRKVLGRESGAEAAGLTAASPARHAEKVSIPVLLIHGRQDSTVPWEQSEGMQKAMAAAGKPTELVTIAGDDHYLSMPESRAQMLQALEGFLAKHLPAG